jgi:hypothetical protein
MGLDHESSQVMKFVYMKSHFSVAVVNKTCNSPTESNVVCCFYLHLACAEYALVTFVVTSDRIRLFVTLYNSECMDLSLET